jgi:tetratricopeptide (TPR) repeat protein
MTAVAAGRRTGDRTVEADSLSRLGAIWLRSGKYHEGIALYRQAAALAADIGLYPQVEAQIGLAACCTALGRLDEADECAARAADVAQDAGFQLLTGEALVATAWVRLGAGAAAEAAGLAGRAAEVQAGTGCRLGQLQALTVLSLALQDAGQAGEAARPWAESLAIAADIGAPASASLSTLRQGEAPERGA